MGGPARTNIRARLHDVSPTTTIEKRASVSRCAQLSHLYELAPSVLGLTLEPPS